MLIADLDPTAVATWAGILVTIAGASGGSFLASRIVLATLCAKVESLVSEVAKIASGDTGMMGIMRTKIDQHGNEIQDIFGRLRRLEEEHARNHGGQRLERIAP
jgi:hypothetical protein